MVSSRKRALRDVEPDVDPQQPSSETSQLLRRIRNSWQFANLFQWIFLFGPVVKINDSLDIDDLEAECLKPQSTVLIDIGLALLKFVSSHRGLTHELFDEYTRRQYLAKAPDRNPFGTGETPASFHDLDAVIKIRVLQQLTQWVMLHPERIREKMDEQKLSDQTEWRVEPAGWDSKDRTYYILDDNRLYRLTPAPPTVPVWKPKKNTKKAKAAARASKRRRTSRSAAQSSNAADDDAASDVEDAPEPEDDGLGGAEWECIGVSLDEIKSFLATIQKSRDDNEKILKDTIETHLLPILEKQEESRQRKELQRQKELLNLEKMAHAKRSSRIANKAEQRRLLQEAKEEEETRRKEEQKRLKFEKEHEKRAKHREERLRERQARRLQHEEELAQLSEDSKGAAGDGRMSERQRQALIVRNNRRLQEIEDESDDWIFDCICGVFGQVDDGTHSVSCERCNVWQHSKCIGVSEEEADREDFHFICKACHRQQHLRTEELKRPVTKLKISPTGITAITSEDDVLVQEPANPAPRTKFLVQPWSSMADHPHLGGAVQKAQAIDRSQIPPIPQPSGFPSIPVKPSGQSYVSPHALPHSNLDGNHAFLSSHPTLSPPEQSPKKSRAYSTLFNSSGSSQTSSPVQAQMPQKGIFQPAPPKSVQESPSRIPPPASVQTPNPGTQGQWTMFSTPQLDRSVYGANETTPTLPPSRNGLSPTKRSPTPHHLNNGIRSSPIPAILPPITTLPPSPSQQILTPPIKSAEPVLPGSRRSSSFGGDI